MCISVETSESPSLCASWCVCVQRHACTWLMHDMQRTGIARALRLWLCHSSVTLGSSHNLSNLLFSHL